MQITGTMQDPPQTPETNGMEPIRHYYGEVLRSHRDLKTGACCTSDSLPDALGPLVAAIHPEVQERFYGCGALLPPALEGATVLDLGCGAGRDVYVLSQLVGEAGRVIGVDMTEAQLAVARAHAESHRERFGHGESNVEFRQGYIEDLAAVGIEEASVDVVVSNCVFNLSPDKARVFSEIFRVLRPGGELYFSDVFADRRIPVTLQADPVLRGECLAGALYTEDFRRLMRRVGCADVRQIQQRPVELRDPEIEAKIGMVRFHSRTFRAFNLELEDRCEDYGHVARYLGSVPGHPHVVELDDHHRFEKGKPVPVCRNTARMLASTRLSSHFVVEGDGSVHYGLFTCGPSEEPPGDPDASCC